MKYQLNPLLEANNPYYNGGKLALAGLSGLGLSAGIPMIIQNNPKLILKYKDEINNSKSDKQLFLICKKIGIDTEDLQYYHRKYHYSLEELKERINSELDKMYKSAVIQRNVGIGLTGLSGAGLVAAAPNVYRATKWMIKH